MRKRYEITNEQRLELERARKENKGKNVDTRLRALIMRAEGKSRKEIGEACEYHPVYVSELVAKYCNGGLSAIVENHYGGNHRNMSFEKEEEFLKQFKEQAAAGQMIETSAIKVAYEKALGRSLNSRSQIYYVLHRHGWRSIMPRSKHPNKASDEVVEATKKLTRAPKN